MIDSLTDWQIQCMYLYVHISNLNIYIYICFWIIYSCLYKCVIVSCMRICVSDPWKCCRASHHSDPFCVLTIRLLPSQAHQGPKTWVRSAALGSTQQMQHMMIIDDTCHYMGSWHISQITFPCHGRSWACLVKVPGSLLHGEQLLVFLMPLVVVGITGIHER